MVCSSREYLFKWLFPHNYTTTQMDYIAKALELPEMLTVVDFIHETAYPIDTFMIDRFWNTINDERLVYVDDELIRWMGYSNEETRKRKRDFMYLLKEANEGSEGMDYYHYSNDEYKEFFAGVIAPANIYPPPGEGRGYVSAKHFLLSPNTLRSTMMRSPLPTFFHCPHDLHKKMNKRPTLLVPNLSPRRPFGSGV
jgi:hypothetical protein